MKSAANGLVTGEAKMKNNSLAMLATISLVVALASIIGYIDPAVCAGLQPTAIEGCVQTAHEHIWAFWGFGGFGAVVLIAGTIRARRNKLREALDVTE
jgi:ABC-type multidrug transport system permease subunit